MRDSVISYYLRKKHNIDFKSFKKYCEDHKNDTYIHKCECDECEKEQELGRIGKHSTEYPPNITYIVNISCSYSRTKTKDYVYTNSSYYSIVLDILKYKRFLSFDEYLNMYLEEGDEEEEEEDVEFYEYILNNISMDPELCEIKQVIH